MNRDDRLRAGIPVAAGTQAFWYGLGEDATVRATGISSTINGLRFDVQYGHDANPDRVGDDRAVSMSTTFWLPAAPALSYGLVAGNDRQGIAACRAVPGRFERIDEGQPFAVVVDYAHTDDALRNTIAIARELTAGA